MVGGACVTEELFPGYRVSSCAYICHLLQAKVIDDLRLREHGFAVYQLEPARFQPYPDGNALVFWDDVDRTVAEMRHLSAHDAAAYPRWLDFWRRAAGLIHPYFLTAPPSLYELLARAQRTGDEDVLETLLTRSMADPRPRLFRVPLAPGRHDPGPRRWRSGSGGQCVLPKLHPLRRVLPAGGLRDCARRHGHDHAGHAAVCRAVRGYRPDRRVRPPGTHRGRGCARGRAVGW